MYEVEGRIGQHRAKEYGGECDDAGDDLMDVMIMPRDRHPASIMSSGS